MIENRRLVHTIHSAARDKSVQSSTIVLKKATSRIEVLAYKLETFHPVSALNHVIRKSSECKKIGYVDVKKEISDVGGTGK